MKVGIPDWETSVKMALNSILVRRITNCGALVFGLKETAQQVSDFLVFGKFEKISYDLLLASSRSQPDAEIC